MKKLKTYSICLGIALGLIIIFSFLINILNYFDLLNISTYKTLIIVLIGISAFTGAFTLGRKTIKKGYLEGLKFGIILSIIMLVLNLLIFGFSFKINTLIYYLIIIISSCIGSMIGINKKQEN